MVFDGEPPISRTSLKKSAVTLSFDLKIQTAHLCPVRRKFGEISTSSL